jgi:hypothetical protein
VVELHLIFFGGLDIFSFLGMFLESERYVSKYDLSKAQLQYLPSVVVPDFDTTRQDGQEK